MSNHQDASGPVCLYGDGTSNPAGPQPGIGDLIVSKSGESILFTPRDDQGQPLAITGIRSTDDIQVLQVVGPSQSATCTLTFDGSTTGPIPVQSLPPLTSFVWRARLPRPGSYEVGAMWANFWGWPPGTSGSTRAYFEVYSAGKRLGAATLDQSQFPGTTSNLDSDISTQGFGTFRRLGVFDFAGTDLEVRLSGDPDAGLLLAGTLRVAPVGAAPQDVGYIDPSHWFPPEYQGALINAAWTVQYGNWTRVYFSSQVLGVHEGYFAFPTGTAGAGLPTADDVTQALAALPNVPPGSVQVTATSNQSMAIRFSGPMGAQAWPTLGCSEAGIRVIHDGTAGSSVGGDYATATVNGVVHQLRAMGFAPGRSRMAFYLTQDAPAVQVRRYGESLTQNVHWYPSGLGVGLAGRVAYADQAGPLINWQFQGLAGPADFQVDVTWPGADPAGDLLEIAVLDGSGRVLATTSGIDQSQAPADSFDAAGVGWRSAGRFTLPLQVNAVTVQARGAGTPGKRVTLDSVRLRRVSPDRVAKIKPGDDVRFRMPPDFIRTSSGSVAAVDNLVVAPPPATRLPAIPRVPKTMKLGYNCDYPIFWAIDSCFSNLAVQAPHPIGQVQDERGNPTKLDVDIYFGGGSAAPPILIALPDSGRGLGVPSASPGVWVLDYTSSTWCTCTLESRDGLCSVTEIASRRVTNGRAKRLYYQIEAQALAPPSLLLRYRSTQPNDDGTYQCDVADVAVYPPDVDPDAPGRWRPGFLEKLRGVQCFRFMDTLATNEMNVSEFSHLPDRANFPLGYGSQKIAVPIDSIGPPEPDPFSEAGSGVVVRVKTKVPHGLASGFIVGLRTTDGSSLGQVQASLVDPKTGATTATPRGPFDPTDGFRGQYAMNLCSVVDETTLQIGIENFGGPLARMTNTLTPANGIVFANVAANARFGADDIADLCIDSGLEPWINVPWLSTDDLVTRLASVLAARLPAGRLVHVEYGNEPWNTAFIGCSYSIRMGKLLGLGDGYIPFYMTRMAQVHRIFRDAWVAAGRDPLDVRRVCGVQQDYAAGTTVPSLDYAVANGISFDELSPACYYSNSPACGPLDDLLTREQLLDLFAMNIQQSDLPWHMGMHTQACRDALARNPSLTWLGDVDLVNYEGGPDTMTTPTMSANLAARNHGVHRHPDFCEIELYHLQMLEDAGVKLFNIFTLYGTREMSQWGVYEGYRMQAGTGDAAIDVANVEDFENLTAIKSETAAALMQWSGLIRQPGTPTGPVGSARRVHRNGKLLTYGAPAC